MEIHGGSRGGGAACALLLGWTILSAKVTKFSKLARSAGERKVLAKNTCLLVNAFTDVCMTESTYQKWSQKVSDIFPK